MELSQDYDVGPEKVDVLADTPSRKIYHCSILIELFNHLLHEDLVQLIIEVVPYGSFVPPKSDLYLMAMMMLLSMIVVPRMSRRTLEAEC